MKFKSKRVQIPFTSEVDYSFYFDVQCIYFFDFVIVFFLDSVCLFCKICQYLLGMNLMLLHFDRDICA